MEPAILLFVLRILSAVLLLAFVGAIGWLIYQDMRTTAQVLARRQQHYGQLRPIDPAGASPYPLLPVTGIGRAASNLVVLNSNYISNEHALITLRGQQWWLEDLKSRNGTTLNGVLLTEATVISPGDIIGIGNINFKFELSDNGLGEKDE